LGTTPERMEPVINIPAEPQRLSGGAERRGGVNPREPDATLQTECWESGAGVVVVS